MAHLPDRPVVVRLTQAATLRRRLYDALYPLLLMMASISVILEVACRRFWFFAMLEHKIFLNFRPYEHRVWHPKFWYRPAFGWLPHGIVVCTGLLAATTKGLSFTLTVCSIQAVSLLLFLSSAIAINDVLCLHEWVERYCVKNTVELRDKLRVAQTEERAALKLVVRGGGGVGTEAAAAATSARAALSTQLSQAVQSGFKEAVAVIDELTVVDETHFVNDLMYVLSERARVQREHAAALKAACAGLSRAARHALEKERGEELAHTLRESWHFRLFDEVDDATGVLLPALGRMHCVPQPQKNTTSWVQSANAVVNQVLAFGVMRHLWAFAAAKNPDAFLDKHKRNTLRCFMMLGVAALLLTIVVELYGFYTMAQVQNNPGASQCEDAMQEACATNSCLRAVCTLKHGYIPAPK